MSRKNKILLLEIIGCLLMTGLLVYFKGQLLLFETNDDQTMIDIISGNFGNSHFYMIYINFVVGMFLRGLYSITTKINWYLLFLSVNTLLAVVSMLKIITSKDIFKNILICLILSFVLQDLFVSFNFTKIAGFIAVAGLLVIYDRYNVKSKLFYVGVYLTFVSSLIRFESFALVLLFFGLIMLVKILKDKEFYKNKRFILLVVLLGVAIILFGINKKMLSDYNAFNNARTNILDYAINNNQELNISSNDYEMLRSWTFDDRDVFSEEFFNSMSIAKEFSVINLIKSVILNGLYALRNYPICLFTFIISILSLIDYKRNIDRKIIMIASFLVVYIVINVMGRVIYRAELLAWLGLLFTLIYLMDFNKYINITLSLLVLYLSCSARYNANVDYQKAIQKRNELITYTSNNQENIYLIDTFTSLDFFYPTKVTEIMPDKYMDNVVLLGSYLTNYPVINEQLQKYELNSTMRDCVNNKKCYLIDNKFTEIKKTYYKEHYDLDVSFIEVYRGDNFVVYSLVSE